MYDAWAIFDENAETVFLGKTFGEYTCNFNGIITPSNTNEAIHEIISYAMYRLLTHRFENSPNATISLDNFTTLFESYGYDTMITSTDYSSNSFAALGNYLVFFLSDFSYLFLFVVLLLSSSPSGLLAFPRPRAARPRKGSPATSTRLIRKYYKGIQCCDFF